MMEMTERSGSLARGGRDGREELLGCPPGVICCTYTTSNTLNGIALFFSYEHLNDTLMCTNRAWPGHSRNKRFSHEFSIPGRNGLWSFTGLSSSSLSHGPISCHIYKQGSDLTVTPPRDLEMNGRALSLSRGLCLPHCCGPGDPPPASFANCHWAEINKTVAARAA